LHPAERLARLLVLKDAQQTAIARALLAKELHDIQIDIAARELARPFAMQDLPERRRRLIAVPMIPVDQFKAAT
jgi:hypothetical protein